MLQISNLTYNAWGRQFLDDASVSLPPGSKVGLVGRNGIGKSTLLRHLVRRRLSAPTTGSTLWAAVSPWRAHTPGALIRQLVQDRPDATPATAADPTPDDLLDALLAAVTTPAESSTEVPGDTAGLIAVDDADLADLDLHGFAADAASELFAAAGEAPGETQTEARDALRLLHRLVGTPR